MHTGYEKIKDKINAAWEDKNPSSMDSVLSAIDEIMKALDHGELRISEKIDGQWVTHAWIKKAILLSFRYRESLLFSGNSCGDMNWFDKVPLKCAGWDAAAFKKAGFRAVPGSIIRHSAYIGPQVVVMPSFINVGAHVGTGTMVDTWVTIGSCAQIGAHCHISGGVGIGGVLEPLQANPVIIEDHCFIGARSEIAEGVRVEEGAVISMGVFIGASTKIVNRATGEIIYGRVPPYSVVIPGTLPSKLQGEPSLACAVIVKQVDAQTRSKVGINELLRL